MKNIRRCALPSDWSQISLVNACVPNGLVRGPFGGALKKESFVDSGYKIYEQRNAICQNAFLGTYCISQGKYNELKRFAVDTGDFIVSCSGTIGKIFRIPEKHYDGVINQALLKITIDDQKLSPDYFYHFFKWDHFQRSIIDDTQGGAMKNLVGMSIF